MTWAFFVAEAVRHLPLTRDRVLTGVLDVHDIREAEVAANAGQEIHVEFADRGSPPAVASYPLPDDASEDKVVGSQTVSSVIDLCQRIPFGDVKVLAHHMFHG